MDEKGFRQGIADGAKALCKHLIKGRSDKVASDTNRELITIVETISSNGIVLPPFVIYKGATSYMGWNQHLDPVQCGNWKFTYSATGWNNRSLCMEWLKHFDAIRKSCLHVVVQYRLLILDGYEIHIHIALVEYCINARIVPYCLPAYTQRICFSHWTSDFIVSYKSTMINRLIS